VTTTIPERSLGDAARQASMSITAVEATELFRREPDRFLDVGAGEVAYRCVGRGPDVLFVHGWPVSGATFRTLLPHLTDHVTCHVIDLPGAGSSRFTADTPLTVDQHIRSVRRVIDLLELDHVAVVGHDSGGLIARYAVAGDRRLRSLGLIDTEQPHGLSWRFKVFLAIRNVPGAGAGLGWVLGRPRLRRNRFVLGGAFADPSLLDGEFDELFLEPLHTSPPRREAAMRLLRSFDQQHVRDLAELHRRIEVPVGLIWGDQDQFFPLAWAEEMVGTFPDADLHVITGAGLFAHEERPAEVAKALLPILTDPT
jgi:haloalkane dehalogenase